MGLSLFKLEKLKILAFADAARSRPIGVFRAMFNPVSFSQSYGITYTGAQGENTSARQMRYVKSPPSKLDLQLVLDGTGVADSGPSGSVPVAQQVKTFLSLAYEYRGDTHEPPYLRVQWGVLSFDCRLATLNVSYSLFDRDGTPLRAELSAGLTADEEDRKRTRKEQKASPDLTHTWLVRAGDTLPLLCRRIYGSAKHYSGVARVNGLDHFRHLEPGTELVFPPLDQLADWAASPRIQKALAGSPADGADR